MKRFNVLTKVALAVVVSLGMMVAMGAKAEAADKVAITDYDDNPVFYVNDVFDEYYGCTAWKGDYTSSYYVDYVDWSPLTLSDIVYSYSYPDNIWGKKYLGTINTPAGTAYVTLWYDIYAYEYYDLDYDEWYEETSVRFDYEAIIPKGDYSIEMSYFDDDLFYYDPVYTMDAPQFYAANSAAINKLATSKLSKYAQYINATF